jgi:hypothetical protein
MARAQPLALPFYHYGMHEVLGVGAKVPARGKTVRVLFGDPIDCRREVAKERDARSLTAIAYEALTDLQQALHPAFRRTPA